jgi:hypothetical protein
MTLERVELELASCFEPGHAYVALSRCVSLEATRLLSFDPSRVRAHPDVITFYRQLDQRDGHAAPPPPTGASLTEEQKERMAANKAAALARAAAKKAEREAQLA